MATEKGWCRSACLLTVLAALLLGGFLSGCATGKQMTDLQMKTDQALQEAQHATEMAKDIESKCMNLNRDATEQYRAVGAAADRAEKAAQRAENAAKSAMDAADRAEAAAEKTQKLYDKIMSK